MKIHYEVHPVTLERKAELRKQGFKIIDARFKPVDVEQEDGKDGKGAKASKGLNVEQIKAALTEKGIEFDASALKPELAKLLDEAE